MYSIAILTFVLSLVGQAQDPGKTDPRENAGWLEFFTGTAKEYEIRRVDSEKHKLEFQPKSILRWTNPVRGPVVDAALFVWLYEGRPSAIGNIFAVPAGDGWSIWHEFHSLDLVPLNASWRDRSVWTPGKAAIELKPVPDAPAPAESLEERTRQMRSIVRDFTANSIDDKDGPWELRLLSQPLYRYGNADSEVLDGTLFVFVQATDPELILLIEARRKDVGYEWQFACARFTDFRIQLRYKGQEIWSVAPGKYKDVTAPHFHFSGEQRESKPRAVDKEPEPKDSEK